MALAEHATALATAKREHAAAVTVERQMAAAAVAEAEVALEAGMAGLDSQLQGRVTAIGSELEAARVAMVRQVRAERQVLLTRCLIFAPLPLPHCSCPTAFAPLRSATFPPPRLFAGHEPVVLQAVGAAGRYRRRRALAGSLAWWRLGARVGVAGRVAVAADCLRFKACRAGWGRVFGAVSSAACSCYFRAAVSTLFFAAVSTAERLPRCALVGAFPR